MKACNVLFLLVFAGAAGAQTVQTVAVKTARTDRTLRLPGEFFPYLTVDLHARVTGFVDKVNVDVGSAVRHGDLLVTLSAPEMKAQILEAQANVKTIEAQRIEILARIAAAESTAQRLKAASATPGAVAANEVIQAEKVVEAARAAVQALDMSVAAAEASLAARRELESYLQVTAPFDGTVTVRHAHPGALAGPGTRDAALLRLEQLSRLRLVVSVPEAEAGGIVPRASVPFTVPAYPGVTFRGVVARIGGVLDAATRTMPVELDVDNPAGKLSPGMYPEAIWPVRSTTQSLLVPAGAVVTTTARSFVIRAANGKAEWVDVRRLRTEGDLAEVLGKLRPGDLVVRQASDEIRDGAPLQSAPAK